MKKIFYLLLAGPSLFFLFFAARPLAFAGSAAEDLSDVADNTKVFDGGDGSTINTSPNAEEIVAAADDDETEAEVPAENNENDEEE